MCMHRTWQAAMRRQRRCDVSMQADIGSVICMLQDLAGRHVFKVEPLNAILDPQYFVRAVHGCVMAVLRERSQAPRNNAAENAGIR